MKNTFILHGTDSNPKAKKFVFLHADNDPYCPLESAQYLAEKLAGELIIKPGQKHFKE